MSAETCADVLSECSVVSPSPEGDAQFHRFVAADVERVVLQIALGYHLPGFPDIPVNVILPLHQNTQLVLYHLYLATYQRAANRPLIYNHSPITIPRAKTCDNLFTDYKNYSLFYNKRQVGKSSLFLANSCGF